MGGTNHSFQSQDNGECEQECEQDVEKVAVCLWVRMMLRTLFIIGSYADVCRGVLRTRLETDESLDLVSTSRQCTTNYNVALQRRKSLRSLGQS